jgi:hypothetical protein
LIKKRFGLLDGYLRGSRELNNAKVAAMTLEQLHKNLFLLES